MLMRLFLLRDILRQKDEVLSFEYIKKKFIIY